MTTTSVTSGRSEQRRRQLLDAAERVVRRDGPDASMSAIAREAGVTKPILYRHFGDKDGLYRALAEEQTDALLEQLVAALGTPGDRRKRVEATIDAYLRVIERQPEMYRFLVRAGADAGPAVSGAVTSFLGRLAAELARAMRAEPGLERLPRDVAATRWVAIVGMVQSAGDWWLDRPRPLSRRRLVRRLADLLWGAYGTSAA
jgi:AcrR family transcriptional regulator